MIERGEKKEEYRPWTEYYRTRLWIPFVCGAYDVVVCLHLGYSNKTMEFEVKDMAVDYGHEKWGAPKEKVYVVFLGNRIK